MGDGGEGEERNRGKSSVKGTKRNNRNSDKEANSVHQRVTEVTKRKWEVGIRKWKVGGQGFDLRNIGSNNVTQKGDLRKDIRGSKVDHGRHF